MRTTISSTNHARSSNHALPDGDAQTDGRRARGERTRLRVLEALLNLVEEGQLRPTAQEVAARAGVALRTVYHHFEDVEALRRMALDLQMSRHREILGQVDPDAPLDERIAMVTRQLRRLFEVITPIRRATLFDEHSSAAMAEGLRNSRMVRRQFMEHTFAPELKDADGERRSLFDAIDVATSWPNWHYMRTALGRGPAACERVLTLTLHELLAAPHN